MNTNIRLLIEVMRDLGIKFKPGYDETAILHAIKERLLRKPDITECSHNTIKLLIQYGYDIVNSEGIVVKKAKKKES